MFGYHTGDYADGKGSFIIMEFLRMGRGGDAGDFGRAMARARVDGGSFLRGRGGTAAAGRRWRRGRGASVGASVAPRPRGVDVTTTRRGRVRPVARFELARGTLAAGLRS